MSVVMGDSGAVNGANTVRQWRVDYLENDNPYAASNTQMGTDRVAGIVDWTGQYFAYGANPAVFPGDDFSFIGQGQASGAGATGTAIGERIQIAWDHENNDYVQHIVHFGGNGDLTLTGTIADSSIPNPVASADLVVKYGPTTGAENTLTDVRKAYLDIRRCWGKPPGQIGNKPYSSSSVAGKVRRVKSRLDFNFYIDAYVSAYNSALPVLQTTYLFRFYTTGSLYWDLKWARVTKIAELGANPEEADLLGVRIFGAMKGYDSATVGYVKSPGAVTEWPG